MEWNDTALILHLGQFRENDLWIRLLSKQKGVFNAFAFGGSRSRKRFCGCLDILNIVKCRIKSSGHGAYLCMQEGILLRGPQLLRKDFVRYGMAVNCIRFLEALGVAEEGADAAFTLLDDLLLYLEDTAHLSKFMPLLFRFALASKQGFAPALDCCAACGSVFYNDGEFSVDEGHLLCSNCCTTGRYGVFLPAQILELLRNVQQSSPALWNANNISFTDQKILAKVIDGFVHYHLGITWDQGRFRKL